MRLPWPNLVQLSAHPVDWLYVRNNSLTQAEATHIKKRRISEQPRRWPTNHLKKRSFKSYHYSSTFYYFFLCLIQSKNQLRKKMTRLNPYSELLHKLLVWRMAKIEIIPLETNNLSRISPQIHMNKCWLRTLPGFGMLCLHILPPAPDLPCDI